MVVVTLITDGETKNSASEGTLVAATALSRELPDGDWSLGAELLLRLPNGCAIRFAPTGGAWKSVDELPRVIVAMAVEAGGVMKLAEIIRRTRETCREA